MSFTDSSFFKLVRSEESTFNEVPSSPTMLELQNTGEGFGFKPKTETSQTIRADRQTPDLVLVGGNIEGDFKFELGYGQYEDLMEHALMSDFTNPVNLSGTDVAAVADDGGSGDSAITTSALDFTAFVKGQWILIGGFANIANNITLQIKTVTTTKITFFGAKLADESASNTITIDNEGTLSNGVTKKSMLFEKQFTDNNLFQNFRGNRIGGMTLDFSVEKIVTGSFKLMGCVASQITTSTIAGGVTPASALEVMNSAVDFKSIEIDNVAATSTLLSIKSEIDNGLRGQSGLGILGNAGIGCGRIQVTGDLEVYLDPAAAIAFYNAGITNTAFKVSYKVEDSSGRAYIFTFYKVKLSDFGANADSIDKDVPIKDSYEAVMDDSGLTGLTMQIDKIES